MLLIVGLDLVVLLFFSFEGKEEMSYLTMHSTHSIYFFFECTDHIPHRFNSGARIPDAFCV